MIKIKLFTALKSSSAVILDGEMVVTVVGNPDNMFVTNTHGLSMKLKDQDIELHEDGTATIVDADGDDMLALFIMKDAKNPKDEGKTFTGSELSGLLSKIVGEKADNDAPGNNVKVSALLGKIGQLIGALKDRVKATRPVNPKHARDADGKLLSAEQVGDQLLRPLIEQLAVICHDNDITFVSGYHIPTTAESGLCMISANILGQDSPEAFHDAYRALRPDTTGSDIVDQAPNDEVKKALADFLGRISSKG